MKKKKSLARRTSPRKRTADERCSASTGSAPLTFEQGYVCAVANLLRDHGETTMAGDLLRGMGNVDWSKIDPYDRNEIKRHGLLPNVRHEPRGGQGSE